MSDPSGEIDSNSTESDSTEHKADDAQASAQEPKNEGEGISLEAQIETLQAENADLKDRLLRTIAEVENVRKRLEKERNDAAKFGIAGFCRDLISVADNFERALTSISDDVRQSGGEPLKNFIVGIEMTERELSSAFEKNGLSQVRPQAGEKFDPNLHQAIAEIPSPEHPSGSVVEVTQTGYSLETRLIRPAMVVVSKGGASAQANPGDGSDATSTNEAAEGEDGPDLGSTVNTTA